MPKNEPHQPRPQRGPAQRARGLEPEITAQPRPISEELALEASAEPDLSIAPEDLGSRFLSDAIEQGEFDPERAWSGSASLFESPAHDEPLSGPNFVAGNSIWEQTVDLETRTRGAADQLREPAPPLPGDDFAAAVENELEEDTAQISTEETLRVAQSSIREFSLLDREGEEGDETISPDVDLDDQRPKQYVRVLRGRDAGPQPRATRTPARDSSARAQQQPERLPGIRSSGLRIVRSVLTHSAWVLRRIARSLDRRAA